MSKIGQVNLDLQEQAEELGFESVQEALDNGYRIWINKDGSSRLDNTKTKPINLDEELEKIHNDYENRKKIIIDKLEMLISDTPYQVYEDTLKEAIDFIKEKEV